MCAWRQDVEESEAGPWGTFMSGFDIAAKTAEISKVRPARRASESPALSRKPALPQDKRTWKATRWGQEHHDPSAPGRPC
jgi:hypothetical protein